MFLSTVGGRVSLVATAAAEDFFAARVETAAGTADAGDAAEHEEEEERGHRAQPVPVHPALTYQWV